MNTLREFVEYKLTHCDKTAEAEGYPLTMQNCKKNKKMRQLELYGNSFQDGTPTPDAPVEVVSVGDKSVNLFDVNTYPLVAGRWLNGVNGNISETGYPLNAYTKDYIPCTELRGKTLTLNHSFGSNPGVCFYDEEKVFLSGLKYNNKTVFTFTVPENAVYYRFSTASEFVDEIQIQEGSTATPYEPYGKYKIPVVQRGINLFSMAKGNATTQTINGITFTPLDDERVYIKGKLADTTKVADYRIRRKNTILIPRGTYKAKPNKYTYEGLTIQFGINNGSQGMNINALKTYVDIPFDNGYIDYAQIYISANTTIEFDDIIELQLVKGEEDLPYEPYVEPVTTNIFLDEPLRKLGDYADYIDFKENKVVRKCVKKYLKDCYWDKFIGEPGNGSYRFNAEDRSIVPDYVDNLPNSDYGLSNAFPVVHTTNYGSYTFVLGIDVGALNVTIIIPAEYLTEKSISALKTWLAENDVYMICIRKTPTEEEITCTLPKTTAKTTIIEVDTSLLPSNAQGKYIKR